MWASRASRGVMRLRLHVKGREWDIGGYGCCWREVGSLQAKRSKNQECLEATTKRVGSNLSAINVHRPMVKEYH